MSLVSVPYQDNGCDCGVFVCRYAYSLYTMRHQRFTRNDYNEEESFSSLITRGPAFMFDMSDIDRIRGEISTLIDKLSELYWEKSRVADIAAECSAKQNGSSNDVNTDAPKGKDEGKAGVNIAVASVEGYGSSEDEIEKMRKLSTDFDSERLLLLDSSNEDAASAERDSAQEDKVSESVLEGEDDASAVATTTYDINDSQLGNHSPPVYY